MRLAVFSDTHGFADYMVSAARRAQPDMLIHLGDCTRDTSALERALPDIPLRCVRGNCDFAALAPESDIFFAGGVKVFAAHGHRYGVKTSLDALLNSAHFAGAQLVLYGHTHIARIDYPRRHDRRQPRHVRRARARHLRDHRHLPRRRHRRQDTARQAALSGRAGRPRRAPLR